MDINDLYKKERDYEKSMFGDYADIKTLNLASFIVFIERYILKAKAAYCGKWDKELPSWLENCKEFQQQGSAPVKVYEELIKIMALAGAALETYSEIDPEKWREDIKEKIEKWKD